MKTIFSKPRLATAMTYIAVTAVMLLLPLAVSAQTISDDCAVCHNDKYQDWKASGHPYKLMKGDIAQNRPIPLPEGYMWDEISYVIGGYKWKSRYMDANGYIITQGKGDVPGKTQYNYMTGEWVDYHADEANGTKPYNCGSCHTTGWVANPDPTDLSGNQDGLPGIHGTFQAGGIQCIQCHGGSMHADIGMIDRSAEACGTCHHRTAAPGDDNVIPASGGWIKHHEQYNEFLASGAHAEAMDCTTCHDPHKRAEFSIKEGMDCESCHDDIAGDYAMTPMADYQVACIDCHMPLATKSGQVTGPHQGDVQTHIFRINTDPAANMFTEDGAFVALDDQGRAAVTLDFACQGCHDTASLEELAKFAKDFHDTEIGLQNVGLNAGLTGTWWGGPDRSGEGFLLEFAYAGPALYFFGSFYTYDNAGNLVWLTFEPATQVPATGTTMDVNVFITEGAKWGSEFSPNDVVRVPFGSGTFSFSTCTMGNVAILPNQDFQAAGFTNMSYDLNRLLEAGISCPSFQHDSGTPVVAN
ncbi:MAG: hypothetical protein V2I48_04235 [Xanthomonadales bacterium]|jgi:hypothetical protein|nr:hypothetical protein [Xanthomonadales bacterium]